MESKLKCLRKPDPLPSQSLRERSVLKNRGKHARTYVIIHSVNTRKHFNETFLVCGNSNGEAFAV